MEQGHKVTFLYRPLHHRKGEVGERTKPLRRMIEGVERQTEMEIITRTAFFRPGSN